MEYANIVAIPIFLGIIGVAIIRFRRLSLRDDVGFRVPALRNVLLWGGAFIIWIAAWELGSGGADWGTWAAKYDATDIAVRIVAVALVYPILEEFFYRGVFLGVVRRRFGDAIGIILPAIVFGLIHVQYDWRGMLFVFVDGLIFGIARVRTGSVYVAMLLHVIGNSFGVWQRLHAYPF